MSLMAQILLGLWLPSLVGGAVRSLVGGAILGAALSSFLLLSHFVLLHHGRHVLSLPHLHLVPVPLLLLCHLPRIPSTSSEHVLLLLMPVVCCGSRLPLPLSSAAGPSPSLVGVAIVWWWHIVAWTWRERWVASRTTGSHSGSSRTIGSHSGSSFSLLPLLVHGKHVLMVPDIGECSR